MADRAFSLLEGYTALPDKKTFIEKLQEQLTFSALSHSLMTSVLEGRLSKEEISYFEPYNDVRPEQQSHLVSLNIPLFGNFHTSYESSIHVFLHDRSVEAGESRVWKSSCKNSSARLD